MALALAKKLRDLFGDEFDKTVLDTFKKLVDAPWMSSGLTENNAFTTTLMIRLAGFLCKTVTGMPAFISDTPKSWETQLKFADFAAFANAVTKREHAFSKFLFEMLPKTLQADLNDFVATGTKREKVERSTSRELMRLINTATFDDPERFKGVKLSEETSKLRKKDLNGYVVAQLNRSLLHDFFPAAIIQASAAKFLKDIAIEMSLNAKLFSINDYPPAAAVVYWFVDGVDRAGIELDKKNWEVLFKFAADEFRRQRSLVVAMHAAMMDPVAMAMSACLCSRLLAISESEPVGATEGHHSLLPTMVELEKSIVELFDEQTLGGIWPKYFPLFHYQDAGSNFCFTFELLEAVLVEFGRRGNGTLSVDLVVSSLERAVAWCEGNRLHCAEDVDGKAVPYSGWNSGGNLDTLRRGQPESWATAVVHMFLWELVDVLSRHIQDRLLETYGAHRPSGKWKSVDSLLDIDLYLDGAHKGLKETLKSTIVKTFRGFEGDKAEGLRRTPVEKAPLSALLFGPPGTSKTEVAKALARELNWPLVEIDPSHFLQDGFQNIYAQAERIFEDVMDLSGVVLLFDEMDALVQKRDSDTALDTESRFLTTYMLPKLAKLHARGQVIFLMATNFQASFDDAIKRAGRFDFLICMGPPTLSSKCDMVHGFFGLEKSTKETLAAGKAIRSLSKGDNWLEDQLSLFTYGEFGSFLGEIANAEKIGKKLKSFKAKAFKEEVERISQSVSLKMNDLEELRKSPGLKKWKRLVDLDPLVFTEQSIAKKTNPKLPAIKYVLDRKQTRRQYVQSAEKLKSGK
jgi:hypothetical protein